MAVVASVALLLVAAAVPRVAAADPAPTPSPAPTASWTVMVYMDGDQIPGDLYLGSWLTHDIDKEMAAVGSDADVQVVALADRGRFPSAADGSWTGARVFHVTKGMTATADNAAADWGPTDMGSPQTLVDFIDWARANYPARHYALFLWDHGWGWWPGNTMEDDTSNDYLDMDELRGALETVHAWTWWAGTPVSARRSRSKPSSAASPTPWPARRTRSATAASPTRTS